MKSMKIAQKSLLVLALVLVAGTVAQAYWTADVDYAVNGVMYDFKVGGHTKPEVPGGWDNYSGQRQHTLVAYLQPPIQDGRQWNENDTSDSDITADFQCTEDNNQRGYSLPDIYCELTGFNAFEVVHMGIVAVGRWENAANNGYVDAARPDYGINNYDVSWGYAPSPLVGSANNFINDVSQGDLLWSKTSTYTGGYEYYTGLFYNYMGAFTADSRGVINFWVGQANVNTTANGARTMIDGVVIVPEPATMGILGLGGLALLRRRK